MSSDPHNDEAALIDLLLGRLGAAEQEDLRRRLEREDGLRRVYDSLGGTFAALSLSPEHEPPDYLVDRTLRRVRSARETDALLAREGLQRRDVIRATFSLRELAAIAAVIVLLATVFGVSWRQAERRREIKQCAAQMGRIGSATLTYANNHNGYLPAADSSGRQWLPKAGRRPVSNSMGLFRLVKSGYVSPVAFQCPAVGGGSFVVRAEMVDFPGARYVSYSYHYSLGPKGLWIEDRRLAGVKKDMAILADSTPVFPNGQFLRERVAARASDNHHALGQNVLYLTGVVRFNDRPSVGVLGDNIYLAGTIVDYQGDEAPISLTDTFLLPSHSSAEDSLQPQQEQ